MDNGWRYAGIEYDDIANGAGLGAVFFTQYCSHSCPSCHNPQTHSRDGGMAFDESVISGLLDYYTDVPFAKRLTLSGGDPLDSPELSEYVIDSVKAHFPNLKVWLYTGYVFEDCYEAHKTLIDKCDYVVDGLFVAELRDITLQFKGSSNQRIIDIQKTLRNGAIVLFEE